VSNGNGKNGRQTIGAVIAAVAIVFIVLGWFWNRVNACDERTASAQAQTAVINARLTNIEAMLSEVRADVKALREERYQEPKR